LGFLNFSGSSNNLCNGTPVNLVFNIGTPSGCFNCTYNWYLDGVSLQLPWPNTNSLTATQPGVYHVEVSNGCSFTSNSITVTGGQNPTAVITADGPTTFCSGNSVTLYVNATTGATYQWKRNGNNIATNSTSTSYKATSSGTYTCEVTNACGTTTSNAIQVSSKTNAAPKVTAGGTTTFCAGDSVTLNCNNLGSNYSVQWYRTNVSMDNQTNWTTVVKQPGTYKVVTKNNSNGCSRISSNSVVVAVNCRMANPQQQITELVHTDFDAKFAGEDSKGKIYVYPNPASDNQFTLELMSLEQDGDALLEIYNSQGQLISSENIIIKGGAFRREIRITDQQRGQLYLIRLIAGEEVYDSKVIMN
jgi:hypothetical protein